MLVWVSISLGNNGVEQNMFLVFNKGDNHML